MIMDYEYFGDGVTIDTTCSTNNAYRPLAMYLQDLITLKEL